MQPSDLHNARIRLVLAVLVSLTVLSAFMAFLLASYR